MSEMGDELGGSELGTKDYWEASYESEIRNYKSHGDVGEVWFDEDSQLRVISWMLKSDLVDLGDSFVDLGSGNGMMLIEMAREGFTHLTGVDYSHKAIELSKAIAKDQDVNVDYKVADMLDEESVKALGTFKIVHDKGTYDAVSLNPEDPKMKREKYIEHLHRLTTTNGLFIITSCNWTENELTAAFDGRFKMHACIPTPTFKFGGKVGNVVTSVVYQKI